MWLFYTVATGPINEQGTLTTVYTDPGDDTLSSTTLIPLTPLE